ncbi:hypothetical protein EDC04DRAFT_2562888, partial [Pisolithus marmoratus]
PFTSGADWQLASWLLHSHLSMDAIDEFLSLQLACPDHFLFIKELSISFQSAKELCLCAEMLPSSPHWKSHSLPSGPDQMQTHIYYHDPVECLRSLFGHPLFASHMSFIPWRVWSSSAWTVHIYEDWMSGTHAWNLLDQIPNSAMLLGVVLSSDKTNILVMTGNRVAHLLLLSLANINSDIHSKGSSCSMSYLHFYP